MTTRYTTHEGPALLIVTTKETAGVDGCWHDRHIAEITVDGYTATRDELTQEQAAFVAAIERGE
ncbi:MAG: hypothetical protein MUD11_07425 [Rhodobacteraceae bacterium]|jgi:hypothetical protein|nr:hypothetical protein [Paracoccaceae bacterium]